MIEQAKEEVPEIILNMNNGEVYKFDLTLPMQMLFDDVVGFVSNAFD